ncbi:hypothetical protein GTPV_gp109 [Goatpox virus Pellor]|uniref:Holliday junction endonuclease n=1 Tax=Goatpox virus TaxID=186805 RepID=A0A1B2LPR7_9POXV|nr:hypothetical protein GTPV_gp109 [Goatpox virus Pellor]AOA33072.1 hypothetical protein GTPV_gp109 [Goatpox virus]QEJ79112.1 Holliday junction endonuclease [Goatpox virus]
MSNNHCLKHIKKEVICAFDIGAKNPARTVLEIESNNIKIIDISKLDWSCKWEEQVAKDLFQHNYNYVLLEQQSKRSPYIKFIHFIKGLLYNSDTKVISVSPVMVGYSYKDRKKKSTESFLNWMKVFGLVNSIPKGKKIDDVADSFNIALRFVLDKWDINYIPYKKNKKIVKKPFKNNNG